MKFRLLKQAFSLAEMMIVLLIATTIIAATAPIITKRAQISNTKSSSTIYPGRAVFTSSGTFTVPSGIKHLWISGCAGGGGGSYMMGVSGGGGQSVLYKQISVTPGQQISITIGSGGAGNKQYFNGSFFNGYANGSAGGNTVVSGYLTLTGGKGGYSKMSTGYSGYNYYGGAAGGFGASSGITGLLQFYMSSPTGPWYTSDCKIYTGATGGNSLFGVGGIGGLSRWGDSAGTNLDPAEDGSGYGAGGGGGAWANLGTGAIKGSPGGNGTSGIIIIEWYPE